MPAALVSINDRLMNRMTEINLATTVLALVSPLVSVVVYFSTDTRVTISAKFILTTVWGLADLSLTTAGVKILVDGIIERRIISIIAGTAILVVSNGVMAVVAWLWATGAP